MSVRGRPRIPARPHGHKWGERMRGPSGLAAIWTGLISYWYLGEASGTRVDTVGVNNLTDNNTVLSAAGISGDAAEFVGASSEYLSRSNADAATLRLGDSFSFSAWFRPTGNATSQMIVAKDYDVARGYAFYYDTNAKIQFQLSATGGGLNTGVISTNSPTNNAWNHVAVTYNHLTNSAVVYLNGTATTAAQASATDESAAEFDIGREAYPGFPFYMTGRIDEVGCWDRALTAQECTDLYNGGAGKFYPN